MNLAVWASMQEWRDIATYLAFVVLLVVSAGVLWFVCRGHNWARWMLAFVVGFRLLRVAAALHQIEDLPHLQFWFLALRVGLQFLGASLLFSNGASVWFSPRAKAA